MMRNFASYGYNSVKQKQFNLLVLPVPLVPGAGYNDGWVPSSLKGMGSEKAREAASWGHSYPGVNWKENSLVAFSFFTQRIICGGFFPLKINMCYWKVILNEIYVYNSLENIGI